MLSASLLAVMLTATIDAKAHPGIETNTSLSFDKDSAGISTNIPIPPKMPQSPSVASVESAIIPPVPQSPTPAPPITSAMPDFVSNASSEAKSENRSAFLEPIGNFGKNILRKVKKEPKPKVISSEGGDLMSQLYDTLERRRKGIAGEKNIGKSKKVVK